MPNFSSRTVPLEVPGVDRKILFKLKQKWWESAACALNTEATGPFETLVPFYHTARRHVPKDSNLHITVVGVSNLTWIKLSHDRIHCAVVSTEMNRNIVFQRHIVCELFIIYSLYNMFRPFMTN
jgi:hypothetical protein